MIQEIAFRDFRESLTVARDAGGADLIFTSPPYCDARTAGAYGIEKPWEESDYRYLGDACFAAVKPGGHVLVNVDAPVREWRKGFGTERGFHAWRLMLDWAERVGFRVPDRLAFGRMGLPGAYTGRFRNDWEPLLWFQRPGASGHFDKGALDSPSPVGTRPGVYGGRRSNGSFSKREVSGAAMEQGVTRRGNFWQYGACGHGQTGSPDLESANHPARFPLRLARDVVACFSPRGGLVCDPFVGAGTTAVACAEAGRRFIGGDLGHRNDGARWADIAAQGVASFLANPVQISLIG